MSQKEFNITPKIAFLGTFHPAVPTFRALARKNWVCVVVLPKEAGYKNDKLLEATDEFKIPWSYDISDIEQYDPNFLLAANYPKIVPKKYIEKFHCINTHWSLLPRWRGVHPTAWAVINGDESVGLTVHMMGEDFDTGAILAQKAVRVTKDLNLNELHEQLSHEQAICVLNVFEDYLKTGVLKKQSQNEKQATYVPQRYPEDGIIDWEWPASRIEGLVKALPLPKYPGAFTYSGMQKIIISKATSVECPPYFCTPGQVVRVKKDGFVWIKTGDTCLEVQEIVIEDGITKKASDVLRRGQKLGFNPQVEILSLKQEIYQLQNKIDQLLKDKNEKI